MSKLTDKWNRRYLAGNDTIPEPALVLKENVHLLPKKGAALDLACGLGGNALYMARLGLSVSAWDVSDIAINKLDQQAAAESLKISSEVRDVTLQPPEAETFDVIVVSYFLHRTTTPSLISALKPQGLLIYQTYTLDKVSQVGPGNPDYLLKENELLDLFKPLKVRVYREERFCGNTKKGLRNKAFFIGQNDIT